MSVLSDDELALGNDSRYKSFIVAIEKVLRQFESSTEWADLLRNLIRLKQVIDSHAQFTFIPKRLTLLKRLAQCLHPALPSGVHLKTLEIYETIFRIIDKRSLQRDIVLYSYGLFPLLSAAALPVKPVLIDLYEKYFFPLDEALNPVLTGFLIGLFSALEEDADYYHRVIKLLDNFANRIDEFYFYTCLWSAIQITGTVRYSAIHFILSHFDKRKDLEHQCHLTGLSTEIMISAICTCLYDNDQPLVQRSMLDFIVTCLPLNKIQLTKINQMKIMTGVFHILLKRDMGFNRRIYTWLLGVKDSSTGNIIELEQQQNNDQIDSETYFIKYTHAILTESLRNELNTIAKNTTLTDMQLNENENKPKTNVTTNSLLPTWTLTKLIRVLLVLVDKPDVGPNIIESLFMNYLLCVYEQVYQPMKKLHPNNIEQKINFPETLKVFNMLLDTLEPYFIWEFLTKNFNIIMNQDEDKDSITGGASIEQICGIINMLIDISSLDSATDTQFEYLPEMFYHLIETMNNNIEKLTSNQIILCIEILSKILTIIIPNDVKPHLFSNQQQQQIFLNNSNEDGLFYTNELVHKPCLITEQQDLKEIECLLHQMIDQVEKQCLESSPLKRIRSPTKLMIKSINHMEKSIQSYKRFFHHFILTFFIDKNQKSTNEKFQKIYSIIQTKTTDNLLTILQRYHQSNEFHLKLNDNIDQYKASFEDCCKLLMELYSFSRQTSINEASVSSKGPYDFDDWLIDLHLLSICNSQNFTLQTYALTVLIELFDYNFKINKLSDTLTNKFLFLIHNTEFFQYIIAYLWEYLNDKYNREYNLKASHLLLLIHSILPNNLCEDLICNQLILKSNEKFQMENYKKFFKLWNLTRDISNINKSFRKSLISVLTILRELNYDYLKSMVQRWIYDCFAHGDMCKIFDILLIRLLHADTIRRKTQASDRISTDSNDQMFIASDDTHEMTFALASDDENTDESDNDGIDENGIEQQELEDDRSIRTISYTDHNETTQSIKSSPQTSKFPSLSTFSQPIISNILAFSPPTLLKSITQRAPSMSFLFSRNPTQSESNSTNNTPSNSLSLPNDHIINDSTEIQDCYIFIYTQTYDYNRVKSSLNIIESLFELISQQLTHTLLITSNNQSSSISIYNNHLHELYFKHRRIEHFSNDHNQEYQSYLYLILNILFMYTYSYYSQNFNPNENNCQIHIHALILLKRIFHDLSYICMDNPILINYVSSLLKKVSYQKIILCLFNRIINRKRDLFRELINYDEQLEKQYLKELINLMEEIILLENIISSIDSSLINQLMVNQPIFILTILQYLKQIQLIENHSLIINFVIRILPHCSSGLKTISIRIIEQICRNLCFIVQYQNQQEMQMKFQHLSSFDPIDYIIYLIQRLSYICNYCLGNTMNTPQHFTQSLCPQHWMKRLTINPTDLSDARQLMLNKLSSTLSSLLYMWKSLSINQTNSQRSDRNLKQIHQTILEFLTLLTKSNGISFIRAIVRCWGEPKRQLKSSSTYKNTTLIDILVNINNYTINDIIYNMNELIRNQTKKKQKYIIWCLQFLLGYLEQRHDVLIDCWSTLAIMFKECLAQSSLPSVTFLIAKILSFYIKHSLTPLEKRDLKDLQDIIMKVLENCNTIIASSLEQTRWLRRNFQVRLTQSDLDNTTIDPVTEPDQTSDIDNNSQDFDDNCQPTNSSLMGLTILSEHAGKLLDTVYNLTDDKDRVVVAYLQTLIINVIPYVRTHVLSNALSYRVASLLIMNISQYSYSKRLWKKEIMEQLFDPGFFQVDLIALRSWKIIIENMITNERSISFRELMNRINTVQTGLFVSKEQEYEQRAMLIKRFAFVIYSSEKDQYNRYLPEILEYISDVLKLPQIPIIYTQIYLFLRVLVLRISSKNLLSFWPTLVSELIQILLQIEQDLLNDIEGDAKSHIQRLTINDIPLTNTANSSLKMYLYACKFLDLLLAIPYSDLDYFQLFRSAFVADYGTISSNTTNDIFIAYSIRLTKLFEKKFATMSTSIRENLPIIKTSNYPLLRLRTISNIIELFPFFNYLASYENFSLINEQKVLSDKINDIDLSVLEDFIESWI